ncbi:hypothetical protein GGX14DRAFT_566020 [Mycena pura]|uniref:Uncharacterized protein n=1 Tax=Mycena pura TaxID=153505 RepID=A0AAD6Y9Z5_9AGAR|nr:hypothetical protein GGX14DRAFT_566020 [Mycena pura]
MSVGFSSDYRNITDKKYAYVNENVRKDYDAKTVTKYIGRKAARKIEEHAGQVRESSSESSESDGDSDHWESVSESETQSESERPYSVPESDDESDASVEIIDPEQFKPPVIELLDDTPPDSPARTPSPSRPPQEIVAAVERSVASVFCMQKLHRLPFLKRNVQRGFLRYCRARGVPTESDSCFSSTSVVFRLADGVLPSYETFIISYECPLCHLHRPFPTKEVLQTHLNEGHPDVFTVWEDIDNKKNWKLDLVFPGEKEDRHLSLTVSMRDYEAPADAEGQLSTPPSPPNPFGPTARFPFLPAKSEFGGPDLKYSVRFGGPKIYDLLGLLPMEPFGVQAWSVLDREEEIFESDDIPDEHKVMHALWARWIFSNRNSFITDYFNGAKEFIDEYWRMIRLAAGWDALRFWLVMLVTTRFLTGRHVMLLLKHYESCCIEE